MMSTQLATFREFVLPGLLPEGLRLVVNLERRIATIVAGEALIAQEVLSALELEIALQLLTSYPAYCPNEQLLAAYLAIDVDEARRRILATVDSQGEAFEVLMHQARNVVWRCRAKLAQLGIAIEALHKTGYHLVKKNAACRLRVDEQAAFSGGYPQSQR